MAYPNFYRPFLPRNIRARRENPPFTAENFLGFYPQFRTLIPDAVLSEFIERANATVKEQQWGTNWKDGMRNYIAHFATLWLMKTGGTDACGGVTAQGVIAGAAPRGFQTSKSVGDVSVSTDYSRIEGALGSWQGWGLTLYGEEFARYAKLVGMGGLYVW